MLPVPKANEQPLSQSPQEEVPRGAGITLWGFSVAGRESIFLPRYGKEKEMLSLSQSDEIFQRSQEEECPQLVRRPLIPRSNAQGRTPATKFQGALSEISHFVCVIILHSRNKSLLVYP